VDPIAFLRSQAPFAQLGQAERAPLERNLEVVYLPAGTRVLERGGAPADYLFLVRTGAVRIERGDGLVYLVEEGELFGYRSIVTGEPPSADAVADNDVLCYRFPAALARPVLRLPHVADALAGALAHRLRDSPPARAAVGMPDPDLGTPVRLLVTRPPVTVPPTTTVADAARLMREAGVSSVLVEGAPLGIVTDRDLRSRVVAESRPPETPIGEVATRPALTLDAGSTLLDAMVFILEHNVHHVPVVDGAALVGMVTDTDVLRRQARSPFYLLRSLERADDPAALTGYAPELSAVVRQLAGAGLQAAAIGRVVSALNDTLVRTLLRLAERQLGPAPAPWAWLALGSEGRFEQMLLTDQDNAIVFAGEPEAADHDGAWFARFAEAVVGGLVACGFPPCRGGFMATNWHLPLPAFMERFSHWMAAPEPDALLDAAIFFDFRKVAGALDLAPLEDLVDTAAGNDLFLAHLASAAGRYHPPIGHFRRLVLRDGAVDMKHGAIGPVVALARVYALAGAVRARPTLDRLQAAGGITGLVAPEDAEDLAEAFRFALTLRLTAQLGQLAAGDPLTNDVEVARLAPLERHHLKDALVVIRDALDGLGWRYAAAGLG
jgi:CBS domain-containing protein